MGYRRRYRTWPPAARRRWNRLIVLLPVILGVGLALVCILAVDAKIRPLVIEMARANVRNEVTGIVEEAVAGAMESEASVYGDIVTLQTDHQGRVTVMTTNPIKLNALRGEILQDVLIRINELDSTQLGIPAGNLTGLAFTSEWGPRIPARILTVAAADGAIQNDFRAAGINQTLHRILLNVTVEIRLMIPGSTVETTVETSVCLAETVIVGEVPQAYLQTQ